jgi:hypothetical protein
MLTLGTGPPTWSGVWLFRGPRDKYTAHAVETNRRPRPEWGGNKLADNVPRQPEQRGTSEGVSQAGFRTETRHALPIWKMGHATHRRWERGYLSCPKPPLTAAVELPPNCLCSPLPSEFQPNPLRPEGITGNPTRFLRTPSGRVAVESPGSPNNEHWNEDAERRRKSQLDCATVGLTPSFTFSTEGPNPFKLNVHNTTMEEPTPPFSFPPDPSDMTGP